MGVAAWNVVTTAVGAVILATIAKVLAEDAKEWTPVITDKLVEWAAAGVPAHIRERCREEWAADVADKPGVVAKLVSAMSLQVASFKERERYAHELLEAFDEELWEALDRMHTYAGRLKPYVQALKANDQGALIDHRAIQELAALFEETVLDIQRRPHLELGLTVAGVKLGWRRLSAKMGVTQLWLRIR